MLEAPAQPVGRLLEGIRVVELATYIAGPATAGIMADWGAEVIKIEQPGGDPLRWLRAEGPGGCSPAFETINRGKLCVELDIASEQGRAAIEKLIAQADVFITNIRPAALARARLDWPSLHALNPQLIYASVTGYGLSGADANTPAFDNAAFWARTGMADVTRPEGADPFSMRQGSGDYTCALTTALGVMTALFSRTRGGGGRLVEASLLRAGAYVMTSDLSNHIRLGQAFPTLPRARALNPLNNFFKTSDGRWFFFMSRSAALDWRPICDVAGMLDLLDDPRFSTPEARTANSPQLIELLDKAFAQMDFATVAERLRESDIVWSPIQNFAEFLTDPQAAAAGCFVDVEDGQGAFFKSPAPPVSFDGAHLQRLGTVAAIGAHTEMILAALGLSAAASES